MISLGDLVRYVGDGEEGGFVHRDLTLGEVYEVVEDDDGFGTFLILDDDGDELAVLTGEFELIGEYHAN